jgi:FAD/FMN-containing dehydrogenase
MDLQPRVRPGDTAQIPEEAITGLRAALQGAMILPGEPGYDAARSIWNAMVDRRPGLIVQAASAADVSRAVTFARNHRAILAVRGGGHNIAGSAVCEGGVMLLPARQPPPSA